MNKISEEKLTHDEDFSNGLLKSMMQETLELEDVKKNPNSNSSFVSDRDYFGSIGKNLAKIFQQPWESVLNEKVSMIYLHSKLLNYDKLSELSQGRSYFSLLAVNIPKSVWIHHLTRDLVDGLASIIRAQRNGNVLERLPHSGVDGAFYLEIGPLINAIFQNVYEKILNQSVSGKLKVRHLLYPGFHRWINAKDKYVVLSYSLESSLLSGNFHLAFPLRIKNTLPFKL